MIVVALVVVMPIIVIATALIMVMPIIVIATVLIMVVPIIVIATMLIMIVPVVAANVIRFVFCRSNEVDAPIAGMIFVTVLAPIFGVVRRHMQVDDGQ